MRIVQYILILIFVATVLPWVGFYFYQDKMIFFPNEPADSDLKPTPPELTRVFVKTSDGLDLMALYFPGDRSKPAILWNHGNAYNVWKLGFVVQPYIDAGFPVYMTEYRGFGGNPGRFSEKGFTRDITAGWDFLKSQGHDKIIVHGYSMGCATSARFAATVHKPIALILETPFSSLESMARHRFANISLMKLFLKYKMNTAADAAKVPAPTLVIHGDADEAIPYDNARAVFNASGATHKDFITIPGGMHRLFKSGSYEKIIEWLNTNVLR